MEYCPICGENTFTLHHERYFKCEACDFTYYHNVAAATVAFIRCKNELLFAIRAYEPFKGMLDLPGGFQEIGETYEEGLQREMKEELGIEIPLEQMHYCFSIPSKYPMPVVDYYSCDAYFEIVYDEKPEITPADDVASVEWIKIDEIDFTRIGFKSMHKAIQQKYLG